MKVVRINKEIRKTISRCNFDGKLVDVIGILTIELEAIPEQYRHSADLEIDADIHYGIPTADVVITYFRPETDAELAMRQAAADARVKTDEEWMRAEYERLKAIFDKSKD